MLLQQTLEELEDEGVELLTAGNGEEAIATIESTRPQLVFLDVMMPKLSGFDVCDRAKRTLGLTDTYIVLLTAKGQEFDRQRGQQVGADMSMVLRQFMGRQRDARTLVSSMAAALGSPIAIEDNDGHLLHGERSQDA